jgi:hypothetical protein
MQSADALAESILVEGHGIFLLTWRERTELERAIRVLLVALGPQPCRDFLIRATAPMSSELLAVLERRQSEDVALANEPILMLFFEETAGRAAGPELNGWRSGLSRPPGSVLVMRDREASEFCSGAPDLCSFLTARRAHADAFIASWRSETASALASASTRAHSITLPASLLALEGDRLSDDEFRAWLRYHLDDHTEG